MAAKTILIMCTPFADQTECLLSAFRLGGHLLVPIPLRQGEQQTCVGGKQECIT
jgi:hypothetical protein